MNIFDCSSPKVVYNKYIGESLTVPCGHCAACLNKRSNDWVKRLQVEASCWRYVVFLTLTYCEEFVPKVYFTEDGNFVSSDFNCDQLLELNATLDDPAVYRLFSSNNYVRFLKYSDIQRFFKRFRRYVDYAINNKEIKERSSERECQAIRYFCCGEYGETTFRPHYHLILFFNSEFIKSNLDKILSVSWSHFYRPTKERKSIGRYDWSFVQSNAYSYVARYLNCFNNLPKCFTTATFRQKSLCSRKPPIGSLLQSETQVLKIFHGGLNIMSVYDPKSCTYALAPLTRTLKNRLFPRIHRFSQIPAFDRVKFYRIADYAWRELDCSSSSVWLRYLRRYIHLYNVDSDLWQYVLDLTSDLSDFKPLVAAIHVSRRVLHQAAIFGVSLEYYVSRINLFYEKFSYFSLTSWMAFQRDYSLLHDHRDLITCDLVALEDLYFHQSKNEVKFSAYGLDQKFPLFNSTFSYRDLRDKSERLMRDNVKTKQKNDYIAAHPEKAIFWYK